MAETASRLANLSPEKRRLLEQLLREKKSPVADPVGDLVFTPGGTPEETKTQYRQFYDGISRRLEASGFGDLSFFLNYGYIANGTREYGAAAPEHIPNRNSVKLVLELIGTCVLEGRDVLDVGCGRGGTISVMQRFFRPRTTVGLDLSRQALSFCARIHRYPGCSFLQGDAERLPFGDGAFDAVSNVESSHSYPDIAAFYAEVYRVLRPGGTFLYTDSLASGAWAARTAVLRQIGFEILRDTDISANVLLSCDDTALRRRQAFGGQEGILDDFLAVPGSAVYEGLRSGAALYRIWTLRK